MHAYMIACAAGDVHDFNMTVPYLIINVCTLRYALYV